MNAAIRDLGVTSPDGSVKIEDRREDIITYGEELRRRVGSVSASVL